MGEPEEKQQVLHWLRSGRDDKLLKSLWLHVKTDKVTASQDDESVGV